MMSTFRLPGRRILNVIGRGRSSSDMTEIEKLFHIATSCSIKYDPKTYCSHNTFTVRQFHLSISKNKEDLRTLDVQNKLTIRSSEMFDEIVKRRAADKVAFETAVRMYIAKESLYRRGHVEFIYAALSRMKEFGCHRDLRMYKKILEVFPEKKMIPKSAWQVEMMHYPRQQQCAIDLMEQMEDNGVIPDHDFGTSLRTIFGPDAHAFRKYRRMMYWMPKFKNANPYPVPWELPEDPIMLAILALKRMAVDLENQINVWKTVEVETDPIEDTFIVSAQSPTQKTLLTQHPQKTPLFVEGGYNVWLRDKYQTYFVLRADPVPSKHEPVKDNDEDLFNWTLFEREESRDIMPALSVHEQDDGTVLAMCITGTATKDSLVTWIRYLQSQNPTLEHTPIVFSLRSPESQIQLLEKEKPKGISIQ